MNTTWLNTLKFIMKCLHIEYQIPLYIVDQQGSLIEEYPSQNFNPLYASKSEGLAFLTQYIQGNYPLIHATNFVEQYLIVPLPAQSTDQANVTETIDYSSLDRLQTQENTDIDIEGALIAGPFFNAIVPEELIKGIIVDHQLSFRQQDEVWAFYKNVPLISKERIYNAAVMIYFMLYHKELDMAELIQHNLHIPAASIHRVHLDSIPHLASSNALSRHDEAEYTPDRYHHNPEMERIFLQYIREGRKEDLIQWELGFPTEKLGVLSKKSLLRNEKNLGICSVTLVTRAAMDGGVNAEIAYTLSDFYIQAVEECENPAQVHMTTQRCNADFVDRVLEGQKQRYSHEVNLTRHYIFSHLYEPIHLQDLAKETKLNADYLSQLFKKEIGCSPIVYIQQQRIDEAKKLISLSHYSLAEISTLLQFHDQSYFTKIFKRYTGVTPKQYQKNRTGGERMGVGVF
ncbi:helix-turn-helix domain-containing protein [Paenibacillus nicotianae]|uniref:Helix-turn-helix domain-containing protein n=1 Tax=Paenibacillus nicotianae TaxID=1526551 RepID=A0ABW4UW90_9BACL